MRQQFKKGDKVTTTSHLGIGVVVEITEIVAVVKRETECTLHSPSELHDPVIVK